MEYEINVAKPCNVNGTDLPNYRHYFRAMVSFGRVRQVYDDLCKAFPDCDITVTAWKKVGEAVDMSTCDY